MRIVLKSGSLNLLEPSGPVQACNGIVVPLPFFCFIQFMPQRCVLLSTPDCTCADYPVCGLSVHDRKVPVTSNEGDATHQCRPGLPVLQDYGSFLDISWAPFWTRDPPITKSSITYDINAVVSNVPNCVWTWDPVNLIYVWPCINNVGKVIYSVHVVPRCRAPNPYLPQQDTIPYVVKSLSLALLKMGESLPETCWADLGDE